MKSSMILIILICGYCSLYAMEKPTPLDLKLFKAVQENKLTEVETLLAQRANPNAPYEENFTPLHAAVDKERQGLAELLLAHNADINAIGKIDHAYGTALHLATVKKNIPLIELLIQRGADLSIRGPYNLKRTTLHIAASTNNNVVNSFIITPSVRVMNQARLSAKERVFPLLCCFHRFAKDEGIGIAIPQNVQKIIWEYSLIPFLIRLVVDEQLKELKTLFNLRMDYLSPSDVAYLCGHSNNKFYEIAKKLDPEKVEQHRALITQSVQQNLTP